MGSAEYGKRDAVKITADIARARPLLLPKQALDNCARGNSPPRMPQFCCTPASARYHTATRAKPNFTRARVAPIHSAGAAASIRPRRRFSACSSYRSAAAAPPRSFSELAAARIEVCSPRRFIFTRPLDGRHVVLKPGRYLAHARSSAILQQGMFRRRPHHF